MFYMICVNTTNCIVLLMPSGAIPSLDDQLDSADDDEAPDYPAAVVIQGTAELSSDPLRCQSGDGKVGRRGEEKCPNACCFKLLFRYWTNGRVVIQVSQANRPPKKTF